MLSRASRTRGLLLRHLQRASTSLPLWATRPTSDYIPPVGRSLHAAQTISTPLAAVDSHDGDIEPEKALLHTLPRELLASIDGQPDDDVSQKDLLQRLRSIPSPPLAYPLSYLDMFCTTYRIARLAKRLLDSDDPSRAIRTLTIAQRVGIAPMHVKELYHKIALAVSDAQRWDLIFELDRVSKECMGHTTVSLLNIWARALVKKNMFSQLPLVLRRFKDEGLAPTKTTFSILISGYLKNHDLSSAIHILNLIQSSGIAVDAKLQAVIAAGYRSFGPDHHIKLQTLQALHHAQPSTATFICNALLQMSLDARENEWAGIMLELFGFDHLDLYRSLNPNGSPFLPDGDDEFSDITMCAATIQAVTTLHITRNAFHILPDIATYTILLHHAARQQDVQSAVSLVAHMERQHVKGDNKFFAALMRVLFAGSLPIAALRMIGDVCPHTITARKILVTLLRKLAGKGDLAIPRIDAQPSIELFNALIAGILPILKLPGVVRVFRLMQECGIQPNGDTTKILASHCDKVQDAHLDILITLTTRLLEDFSDATLHHCDILLSAVFRRAARNRGYSAWIPSDTHNGMSFPVSYPAPTRMLTAYARDREPTAGLELQVKRVKAATDRLLRALNKRGVFANGDMFRYRMQYEIARGDLGAAQEVFQAMLDRGIYPTSAHYSQLMQGYASEGNMVGARQVFTTALDAGIKPNVVMYTVLITGCARLSDPDGAMAAFNEMVQRGIRPDRAAVDALVSASMRVGEIHTARKTLIAAWPADVPQPKNIHIMSLKFIARTLRAAWPQDRPSDAKLPPQERAVLVKNLRKVVRNFSYARRSHKDRATSDETDELREESDSGTDSPTTGSREVSI